jgi:hypothetical protein
MQHLQPSLPRSCGVGKAVDPEVEYAVTAALVDPQNREDGVNWFRWLLFWPAFDWLKEPQEAFLAFRD